MEWKGIQAEFGGYSKFFEYCWGYINVAYPSYAPLQFMESMEYHRNFNYLIEKVMAVTDSIIPSGIKKVFSLYL